MTAVVPLLRRCAISMRGVDVRHADFHTQYKATMLFTGQDQTRRQILPTYKVHSWSGWRCQLHTGHR